MSECIELDHPITVTGEKITSLNLRRVTVRDIEIMNMEKSEMAKSIRLLAMISDHAEDDIRNLDVSDFNKASQVVADFLE